MAFEIPTSFKSDKIRRADLPRLMELAEAGEVSAQIELAWKYAEGRVIDADFVKAARLFETAASTGNVEAQLNRARFLYLRRVPDGVRIIRKFARAGNLKAQFWLGLRYRVRPGRINHLRAAVWFKRARERGSFSGAILLDRQMIALAPLFMRPFLWVAIFGRWFWKLVISNEFKGCDMEGEFNHSFTRLKRR